MGKVKNWVEEHKDGIELAGINALLLATCGLCGYAGYLVGWGKSGYIMRELTIRNPEIKTLCEAAANEINTIFGKT